MNLIKRDFIINKSNYIFIYILILAIFIVGEFVGLAILKISGIEQGYSSFGLVFSYLISPIIVVIVNTQTFYINFKIAVNMSITRKNYMVGSIINMCITYYIYIFSLYIFNIVDKFFVNIIYPNIKYLIDAGTFLSFKTLLAPIILTGLSIFFVSLIYKYKKYIGYIFLCFIIILFSISNIVLLAIVSLILFVVGIYMLKTESVS